ncbi:MAG TPA: hydrogenase 2 operon protein HybA [Candidatus Binatia bacterium]|nr:hydrogenase 2 operon protein HybA [Candidatus Binatia bacterium]
MEITRRDLLQRITTGSAAIAVSGAVSAATMTGLAHAEEPAKVPPRAVGMLYDATRCIGCQTCVVACTKANDLQPDNRRDPLHQAPGDLNYRTKTLIKLYKAADGKEFSFVKQQCMHCVDPACVSACMFGGLKKDSKSGVVTWNGKYCVGCRYCEVACPYNIPKFQWEGFNPRIVKCELCKDRLAQGEEPACTAVCPKKAVVFGTREELLKEAKLRIAQNPGKYFENRVFGEKEGGGTQVLYLSHVSFSAIGLPELGDESVPRKYLKWQRRLYSYLILPAGLYAVLVGSIRKNWKHHEEHMREEEQETGLRAQL